MMSCFCWSPVLCINGFVVKCQPAPDVENVVFWLSTPYNLFTRPKKF